MKKIPEISIVFWIMKICAKTAIILTYLLSDKTKTETEIAKI